MLELEEKMAISRSDFRILAQNDFVKLKNRGCTLFKTEDGVRGRGGQLLRKQGKAA